MDYPNKRYDKVVHNPPVSKFAAKYKTSKLIKATPVIEIHSDSVCHISPYDGEIDVPKALVDEHPDWFNVSS